MLLGAIYIAQALVASCPTKIMPGPPPEKKTHDAKVCSVLLPVYPATVYQSMDSFKGYDKVTKSPDHLTLPRWKVSPEKVAKYRAR